VSEDLFSAWPSAGPSQAMSGSPNANVFLVSFVLLRSSRKFQRGRPSEKLGEGQIGEMKASYCLVGWSGTGGPGLMTKPPCPAPSTDLEARLHRSPSAPWISQQKNVKLIITASNSDED
jgi:hypothetical protein